MFESLKISIIIFLTSNSGYEPLCGFVGWGLTAIPSGVLLYFILKTIFSFFGRLKAKKQLEESGG